jgi:hypothetical protein
MNEALSWALDWVILPSLISLMVVWVCRVPSPFGRRIYVLSFGDAEPSHELYQTLRHARRMQKALTRHGGVVTIHERWAQ